MSKEFEVVSHRKLFDGHIYLVDHPDFSYVVQTKERHFMCEDYVNTWKLPPECKSKEERLDWIRSTMTKNDWVICFVYKPTFDYEEAQAYFKSCQLVPHGNLLRCRFKSEDLMTMSEKLIFLDLDGVLCTWDSQGGDSDKWEESYDKYKFAPLNKDCVARLNRFVDETGAKVVISSSWRKGSSEAFRQLKSYLEDIYGVKGIVGRTTDMPDMIRGDEIHSYLVNNYGSRDPLAPTYEPKYVIFDDDDDMGYLSPRLILIEGGMNYGLQDDHIDRARVMLNG